MTDGAFTDLAITVLDYISETAFSSITGKYLPGAGRRNIVAKTIVE